MRNALLLCCLIGLSSPGCTYYKITDPGSGKVYYTDNWRSARYGWNGAVRFTDIGSGQLVTLQNSELKVVDGEAVQLQTGKR